MPRHLTHTLIPSARRLVESLRDLGYDFAPAVADLIDNSIAAGATKVSVSVEFKGVDSYVMIADNGRGMTPERLLEAMRYGSEREYEEDDLGKFGLGLKTSSLSQCRRLTVACRESKAAKLWAYAWDLDHIKKTNKWDVVRIPARELRLRAAEQLDGRRGTVVLWEHLDRIVDLKHPEGEVARSRVLQMCRDLEEHLAMVFHRFLAGEVKGKELELVLNGNAVKPWDPFCRAEPKTQKLESFKVSVGENGEQGAVLVRPFILPSQSSFSTPEAFRAARGPASWNAQQGLYIYRAHRLIQSGGWSRLRTNDEHSKLARVAVDFGPRLDGEFKVNVAKMRVSLPTVLRAALDKGLAPVVKHAKAAYNAKGGDARSGGTRSPVKSSDSASNRPKYDDRVGELRMTFARFAQLCEGAASVKERPVLLSVLEKAARHIE